MEATTRTREKYWKHWLRYSTGVSIDPLLQTTDHFIRDIVITAFAARVRTGSYGLKHQITVQSVTQALSAISKTIELAGYRSPVYRSPNVYNLQVECLVEGYRRQDPPSVPQLVVPIEVPENMANTAYLSDHPLLQAIADLALIAFYYLLRVGEYTAPAFVIRNGQRIRTTRTVQFTVGDIGFHKDNKVVPRRSPFAVLLACDQCTYKITNQKNGRMGQTISHETIIDNVHGPVKASARRVHHILSNGGNEDTIISAVLKDNGTWTSVTPAQMRSGLRLSVKQLGLHKNGIDPDLVGVHSLRAGGAMAMKLTDHSDTTIKKYGRWSSNTWLDYIHNQIAHLAKGVSTLMSTKITFINVANIEPRPEN